MWGSASRLEGTNKAMAWPQAGQEACGDQGGLSQEKESALSSWTFL